MRLDRPVITEDFLKQPALEGSIPSMTQRREHRVRVKVAAAPLLLRERRGPSGVRPLSIFVSPLWASLQFLCRFPKLFLSLG